MNYGYKRTNRKVNSSLVFQDEPNLTKVPPAQNSSKQIIAFSFGKTDHAAAVPLDDCRTVNSDWYTTICFTEVFSKIL